MSQNMSQNKCFDPILRIMKSRYRKFSSKWFIRYKFYHTFGSNPIQADEQKDNKELKSVIQSIIKEDPLVLI